MQRLPSRSPRETVAQNHRLVALLSPVLVPTMAHEAPPMHLLWRGQGAWKGAGGRCRPAPVGQEPTGVRRRSHDPHTDEKFAGCSEERTSPDGEEILGAPQA